MNIQFLQSLGLCDSYGNLVSQQNVIFALFGDHNVGKTYVISLLCKFMKYKYQGCYKTFPRMCDPYHGPKSEVRFIFDLCNRRVGITSEGDQVNVLSADLKYLITQRCDTIICACSPKGPNTSKTVQNIATTSHYANHFIDMQRVIQACPSNEKELAAFELAVNFF